MANHVRQVHETEQPEPEKPEPPAPFVNEVHSEAVTGDVEAEATTTEAEAASTASIAATDDVLLKSKFAAELFRIIAGLTERIKDLEAKLEYSRPQTGISTPCSSPPSWVGNLRENSPIAPETPRLPQVQTPDHSKQQRQQVYQQQQEQRKQQHQIWL